MDNLRDLVMKAVDDLRPRLMPLQSDDDYFEQQMNQEINLAEKLARLKVRRGLIQQRMATITNQKDLVDAAVVKCPPKGQTQELVITFLLLVKTLQSDCQKVQKHIQEWDEILNAVDFLQKQKQELQKEELKRGQEVREMQAKYKKRKNILELAWNMMSEEMMSEEMMSEEMMSSRQESGEALDGPSTGLDTQDNDDD